MFHIEIKLCLLPFLQIVNSGAGAAGRTEDAQFVCPAATAWVTKRIGPTPVNSIQDRGQRRT